MELPSEDNTSHALSMTLQGGRGSASAQLIESLGGEAPPCPYCLRAQRVHQRKTYHLAASAALCCVLALVSLLLICYRISLGSADPGGVKRALANRPPEGQENEGDPQASAFLEPCMQMSDQLSYSGVSGPPLEHTHEAATPSISSMQQQGVTLDFSALGTAVGASASYYQLSQFPITQHGSAPPSLVYPEVPSTMGQQAPEATETVTLTLYEIPYVPLQEPETQIDGQQLHWAESASISTGSSQGFQNLQGDVNPMARFDVGCGGFPVGPPPPAQAPHLYSHQQISSELSGETATAGLLLHATPCEWPAESLASETVGQLSVPQTVASEVILQPGLSEAPHEQREEETDGNQPRLPLRRSKRKRPTEKKKPEKRSTAPRKSKTKFRKGDKGSHDSSETPETQKTHTALTSLLLDLQSEPPVGEDNPRELASAETPGGLLATSTSTEVGREGTEEQEDPLGECGSTGNCVVTVKLPSGSVCHIPHPPPLMSRSMHLYYRLPHVPKSAIQRLFEWQPAMTAGPRGRKFRMHLHECVSLLAKEELNEEEVNHLLESLKNVLRHMIRKHTNDVRLMDPYRASDILAMRYLSFDLLVASIQLFGPAMRAQNWFPVLVQSVPTTYTLNRGLQSPEASEFTMFCVKLSAHLNLLKHGVRPDMNSTIQLKKELFRKAAPECIYKGEMWDKLRQIGEDV